MYQKCTMHEISLCLWKQHKMFVYQKACIEMHDARQCTKIIKTNYYILYSRELSIYSIQIPNYSDPFRSFEKKTQFLFYTSCGYWFGNPHVPWI